ncbi:guanine nucleotide exchange protein for ADP-robosylation factor, partial [Rhizophlyctis rosea]
MGRNSPGPPSPGAGGRPSTATLSGAGGGASTDVFIRVALQQLQDAKETKKLQNLRDGVKHALETLDATSAHGTLDAEAIQSIFGPFRLACQSRQPALATIAIDCLGKLFSYNYWGRHDVAILQGLGGSNTDLDMEPSTGAPRPSGDEDRSSMESNGEGTGGMLELVVDTICNTFTGGDNTDDKVQLQIVKALLAAVSNTDPNSAIHGGILLKAIRTTYNIFLYSKSPATQSIAQVHLTQMIQAVFGRVPKELAKPEEKKPPTSGAGTPTSSTESPGRASMETSIVSPGAESVGGTTPGSSVAEGEEIKAGGGS